MWALGVLLYFMLVGLTPFKGETLTDLKEVFPCLPVPPYAILPDHHPRPLHHPGVRLLRRLQPHQMSPPNGPGKASGCHRCQGIRGQFKSRPFSEKSMAQRVPVPRFINKFVSGHGSTTDGEETDTGAGRPTGLCHGTLQVWKLLHSYGITETMVMEATEKGPRHSITGIYRIVQFQAEQMRLKVGYSSSTVTKGYSRQRRVSRTTPSSRTRRPS